MLSVSFSFFFEVGEGFSYRCRHCGDHGRSVQPCGADSQRHDLTGPSEPGLAALLQSRPRSETNAAAKAKGSLQKAAERATGDPPDTTGLTVSAATPRECGDDFATALYDPTRSTAVPGVRFRVCIWKPVVFITRISSSVEAHSRYGKGKVDSSGRLVICIPERVRFENRGNTSKTGACCAKTGSAKQVRGNRARRCPAFLYSSAGGAALIEPSHRTHRDETLKTLILKSDVVKTATFKGCVK